MRDFTGGPFFARHTLTVRADLILDMVHVLTGEARNDVFLVSFSLCGLMLRLVLSQQFFLFFAFLIFKILLYNFSSPPIPSPPPDIHVISRNYLLNVLTNLLAAFFLREPLLSCFQTRYLYLPGDSGTFLTPNFFGDWESKKWKRTFSARTSPFLSVYQFTDPIWNTQRPCVVQSRYSNDIP